MTGNREGGRERDRDMGGSQGGKGGRERERESKIGEKLLSHGITGLKLPIFNILQQGF